MGPPLGGELMPKKKNATRKDGRIAVQVYIGRTDGKRKYKTVYGLTQKEADEKALQVKLSMRKGLDVSAERDTFGEWAGRWLKVKATEVSPGQTANYASAIKHLNKVLEQAPISKIRANDIQSVITDLSARNPNTGKPAARQTLKVIQITASQIFRLAIENRVLDYNPAMAVKIPANAPEGKRRALASEEQEWLLKTPHRAQRAAMIMMYAGLRRGELIPLMWSDIDLGKGTIQIVKSVQRVGSGLVVRNATKTKSGIRTVYIPDVLVSYLKGEKRDSLYVCPSIDKAMHTESTWKRMWDSYLTDLNIKYGDFSPFKKRPKSKFDPAGVPFVIPRITPHWLRHTFATMLYFAGVDVLTAKEQLGHADIQTTLRIYTHLDQQHKKKSMNKLNNYLRNASLMQVKEI